jgi:DNA-binding phage protein
MAMKQLVQLLQSAIETKAVTITQLAADTGCSRQHIYNVLQGKQIPSLIMAEKLADSIGFTLTVTTRKKSQKISA